VSAPVSALAAPARVWARRRLGLRATNDRTHQPPKPPRRAPYGIPPLAPASSRHPHPQSGYYETINRGLDYAIGSAREQAARNLSSTGTQMELASTLTAQAMLTPVVAFLRTASDAACGVHNGRRCARYYNDFLQSFSAAASTPMPRPGAASGGLVPPMTGRTPGSSGSSQNGAQMQSSMTPSVRPSGTLTALPSYSMQPSGVPARPADMGLTALGIFNCLNSDFLSECAQRACLRAMSVCARL